MRTRLSLLLAAILVLLSALPVVADDGETYTVQPGDNYWKVARLFGISVDALLAANRRANPDLLRVGERLIIPGASGATTTSGQTTFSNSAFSVAVGTPLYGGDGYQVVIPITVTNKSVTPSIAGGKYASILKPDGNYEDVALVKPIHSTFEIPQPGEALLWQATVYLSDGTSHFMTVGCRFTETVHAEGDEPVERTPEGVWITWYHWERDLYDGWFDCGNSYRVNPPNIAPGTSGTSVLTVYLVNPHNRALSGAIVGTPYPGRKVTKLDITVFKPDGTKVGTNTVTVP